MKCKICGIEFEKHHFNQTICSLECKNISIKNIKTKYKKSEKGKISNSKWQKSKRFKSNEKIYRQKPKAKFKAVLRSIKCLKNNIHLQIKKKIRDNNFAHSKAGKTVNKKAVLKYQKSEHGQATSKISRKNSKAINRGAQGRFSLDEWNGLLKKQNYCCANCKSLTKLEADHIVPVSKGGNNTIDNIQILCRKCNAKKHLKVIKYAV